ncbi:MAG: TylF/MycF/NovP-related O-methyltransferase [Candidatus Sericytochromatia bacterium]
MTFALCLLAEGLRLQPDFLAAMNEFGSELLVLNPAQEQDWQGLQPRCFASFAQLPGDYDWLLVLYPWERPAFGRTQLEYMIFELPDELSRVGLMVKSADGLCWNWSARLLRRGADWQPDDPGEALSDDLVLQVSPAGLDVPSGPRHSHLQALTGKPPELDAIRALLAQPWPLEAVACEQILVYAADAALRAWKQEESAQILALGLERFPDSPALGLLMSGLLSAGGRHQECRAALQRLEQGQDSIWTRPTSMLQPAYLAHLQTLLAFWAGDDPRVLAGLRELGFELELPDRTVLLAALQRGDSLLERGEAQQGQVVFGPAATSAAALPKALRECARQFVPDLEGFPELGCLDCHHLDFIALERLYPDKLHSRLLYGLARCQLQLGQSQAALASLAQALANPMGSPGKIAAVLADFYGFLASGLGGDVAELGCNQGSTSLLFQTLIQHRAAGKALHVYDSFEGLPPPRAEDGDTPYQAGSCTTAREAFVTRFQAFGMPLPVIHEGWFSQTLPQQLPASIGFAYLDGDFYSSILESLEAVYPRLLPGAVVLIDDFGSAGLKGVEAACNDFFAAKPESVEAIFSNGIESVGRFVKA